MHQQCWIEYTPAGMEGEIKIKRVVKTDGWIFQHVTFLLGDVSALWCQIANSLMKTRVWMQIVIEAEHLAMDSSIRHLKR